MLFQKLNSPLGLVLGSGYWIRLVFPYSKNFSISKIPSQKLGWTKLSLKKDGVEYWQKKQPGPVHLKIRAGKARPICQAWDLQPCLPFVRGWKSFARTPQAKREDLRSLGQLTNSSRARGPDRRERLKKLRSTYNFEESERIQGQSTTLSEAKLKGLWPI